MSELTVNPTPEPTTDLAKVVKALESRRRLTALLWWGWRR